MQNLKEVVAQHSKTAWATYTSGDMDDSAACQAMEPALQDLAQAFVDDSYNPLREIDWDQDDLKDQLLRTWRQCIKDWRDEGFVDPLPGERAINYIAWTMLDEHPNPLDDHEQRPHLSQSIVDALDLLSEQWPSDVMNQFEDTINQKIQDLWLEQAVKEGIPSHVRAEVWWVPGWDGESLDDTEHLHIRGNRWNSTYIENVLPSEGLRNFLQWLNISSDEFIAAALVHRPPEGETLKESLNGASFCVDKDHSRPSLITPEQALVMVENAGYIDCLPTVHAHVELGALLKLDPRLPIALPLPKGQMHIGLHNTINGAGYMDTYDGEAIIAPMSLGMGWASRGSYGVDKTYGLYRPALYCTPHNVAGLGAEQDSEQSAHGYMTERMRG